MKREDIEKAANEFADREYEYNDIDRDALYKGFYWGAQWRINSVWHDASEIIIKPGFILIEFQNKHELCYNIWRVKSTDIAAAWGKFMKENKAIRYAYIKDLLPIKEE